MVMDPSIAPPWTLRPDPATLASTRRMCSRLLQQPDLFATAFQDNFRVYGQTGEPCVDCGTPIARIIVGQRSTHFCPACQKE